MTQESADPEHHYVEPSEESRANRPVMSETHHRRNVAPRRRTFSENAVEQQTETKNGPSEHLRRRVKSGDDHRTRTGSFLQFPFKSPSSFHSHYVPWDKQPLLPKKDLDPLTQVALCSICNSLHSEDSSCDNQSSSTSSSSQSHSYEKISSGPSGRQSVASTNEELKVSSHDLNHVSLNKFEPSHKDSVSELRNLNGVVNTGIDIYIERPSLNHKNDENVPSVTVLPTSNGHVPNQVQRPEYNMLLEDDPSKAQEIDDSARKKISKCRANFGLFVLLFANTLNYMDRYTIAGVLINVQDFYGLDNAQVGLLQTSFIISYMVFSPIFGFLGDRYSRKIIMSVGIFTWSLVTLGSSFIGRDYFYLFLFMRALVGIGEASYSTIAPTIIADLFIGTSRTKALSVFYFAIPVGSGLGYIAGSKVAQAAGNWQWALRVTPGFGAICVLLIIFFVSEPQRGAAEGGAHIHSTSWFADIKYLFRHKSFLLSSAGFTCVAFVAGAMALWTPTYMYYSIRQRPEDVELSNVAMIFGLITCFSGFTGVAMGSWVASKLRPKIGAMADPLVCAFGLITCAPFLYASLLMSRSNPILTWVLIFLGETFLSLNWALVTDILLYIIVPNRRASAEAIQILMSHALGDAGSPYIIGLVADHIQADPTFPSWRAGQYLSLQYSLYVCCMVSVLGGGFFLANSLYIRKDKKAVEDIIKNSRMGTIVVTPSGEIIRNNESQVFSHETPIGEVQT